MIKIAKNNAGTMIAVIAVLGFGFLVFNGTIDLGGLGTGSTQSIFSSGDSVSSIQQCGDDGQSDADYRYRNILNTTQADFHSSTGSIGLTLVDAGTNQIKQTLTADNADGTFDSDANVLECGKQYYVVVVDSATEVAVKSDTVTANGPATEFDVKGARSSQVNFNLYSTSFGNESNSGPNGQDFASNTNTALGTGNTLDLRYDVAAADSAAQFGANERICETKTGVCGKAFVCVTGASSIYDSSDLTISGGPVVGRTASLPALCEISTPTNAGVGRAAFEINAVKNADGRMSGTLSVTSSLGNPADTNNVRFIWMDNSYYTGNDNTVKVGTSDDSGTDNGETNNYFEADIT